MITKKNVQIIQPTIGLEAEKLIRCQLTVFKGNTCNLRVVVCGVIVNPLIHVAAAGINGFLVFLTHFNTSILLDDRTENVKKLANAFCFGFSTDGIELCEGGSDKT